MTRGGRTATFMRRASPSSRDLRSELSGELSDGVVTGAILSGGPRREQCAVTTHFAGGYANYRGREPYGISRPPQIAARRAKRRKARSDIEKREVPLLRSLSQVFGAEAGSADRWLSYGAVARSGGVDFPHDGRGGPRAQRRAIFLDARSGGCGRGELAQGTQCITSKSRPNRWTLGRSLVPEHECHTDQARYRNAAPHKSCNNLRIDGGARERTSYVLATRASASARGCNTDSLQQPRRGNCFN
jgi:hypothetical protein